MLPDTIATKICKAVEIIIDKKVRQLKFNTTIQGKILTAIDDTKGWYRIQYQNSIINAYSLTTDIKYAPGDIVYILLLNNNDPYFSHIILTKKPKEEDYY